MDIHDAGAGMNWLACEVGLLSQWRGETGVRMVVWGAVEEARAVLSAGVVMAGVCR